LSSGLHHAKRDKYAGFCYVNGLALAALHAIEYFTLQDVGILDLDAHCGGGTFELVGNNPQVRLSDVSVVGYDTWSSTDPRHFIKIVKSADQYLDEVKNSLEHLRGIDFLIYNAGMDPFEDGGGMRGITREILEERERLVAQWCIDTQTPALFVLAGGYTSSKLDLDGLAKLHIPTIKEFRRILSNK
jgi:acetoin utilization deacetylase AcuC-like enzyme